MGSLVAAMLADGNQEEWTNLNLVYTQRSQSETTLWKISVLTAGCFQSFTAVFDETNPITKTRPKQRKSEHPKTSVHRWNNRGISPEFRLLVTV